MGVSSFESDEDDEIRSGGVSGKGRRSRILISTDEETSESEAKVDRTEVADNNEVGKSKEDRGMAKPIQSASSGSDEDEPKRNQVQPAIQSAGSASDDDEPKRNQVQPAIQSAGSGSDDDEPKRNQVQPAIQSPSSGSDEDEPKTNHVEPNSFPTTLKFNLLTNDDIGDESLSEEEKRDENHRPTYDSSENDRKSPSPIKINERKRVKTKRKSEKVDEKLAIRSETQRMVRESSVCLPYHVAKQRSLREFLERRKSTKMPLNQLRSMSTKMHGVWSEIDKSTKDALEFFKSDSEEEDKDELVTSALTPTVGIVAACEAEIKIVTATATEVDIAVTSVSKVLVIGDSIIDSENFAIVADQLTTATTDAPVSENRAIVDDTHCNVLPTEPTNDVTIRPSENPSIIVDDSRRNVQPTAPFNDAPITENRSIVNSNECNVLPTEHRNDALVTENPAILGACKMQPVVPANDAPITESSAIVDDHCTVQSAAPKNDAPLSDNRAIVDANQCSVQPIAQLNDAPSNEEINETTGRTMSPLEKTGKWLNDIRLFEKKQAIRKRLDPRLLASIPKLSTDFDDFIEVEPAEATSLKPGARQLMERLFKSHKVQGQSSTETVTTVNAITDETGAIKDISTEVFVVSRTEDKFAGRKQTFQNLRGQLLNDIENKWKEGFSKRCMEFSTSNKTDFEDEAPEDDADDELDEEEAEETEPESEPEEDDVDLTEKPRKFCAFGDSEAEESSGEEENDDASEKINSENEMDIEENNSRTVPDVPISIEADGRREDNTEENDKNLDDDENDEFGESLIPAYQPGGGVRHGTPVLTQHSQKLPIRILSPTSSPMTPAVKNVTSSTTKDLELTEKKVTTPKATPYDTNSLSAVKKNLFSGDTPIHVNNSKDEGTEDDPFMFVSGVFPDTAAVPPTPRASRILSFEESNDGCDPSPVPEETADPDDISVQVGLDLHNEDSNPPFKKKKKKLTFSDDESDGGVSDADDEKDEPVDEVYPESELESDNEVGEAPPDGVEYDSEENEIVPVKAADFFEAEAELSESEWSGDEDERDLDKLDAEAGDEDVLDHEQVASQLGRIHMRRVMDEDARDVRLLQEILLEDGDLHSDGKGRERKFRWKNLTGFEMNDDNQMANEQESDTEQDGDLAQRRHERAQLLLKLQQEGKPLLEDNDLGDDPLFQLGNKLLQRLNNKASTTQQPPLNSTDLIPRSSFLTQDTDFLTRLAKGTGSAKDALLGPSHSRNFVFATKSPEKTANVENASKSCKRKATSCGEVSKRPKLFPPLNSGPSILENLH